MNQITIHFYVVVHVQVFKQKHPAPNRLVCCNNEFVVQLISKRYK